MNVKESEPLPGVFLTESNDGTTYTMTIKNTTDQPVNFDDLPPGRVEAAPERVFAGLRADRADISAGWLA